MWFAVELSYQIVVQSFSSQSAHQLVEISSKVAKASLVAVTVT
jgi:hypothetical protein